MSTYKEGWSAHAPEGKLIWCKNERQWGHIHNKHNLSAGKRPRKTRTFAMEMRKEEVKP